MICWFIEYFGPEQNVTTTSGQYYCPEGMPRRPLNLLYFATLVLFILTSAGQISIKLNSNIYSPEENNPKVLDVFLIFSLMPTEVQQD